MKVVLFGASGMIGSGVLLECLDDSRVTSVVSIARTASGVRHEKFREVLRQDFFDYTGAEDALRSTDACFFCLGTTSSGKPEAEYRRLTVGLTLAAAKAVLAVSPELVFVFVSGQGTDSTGTSRVMWSRVKGEAENALRAMPFRAAFMFRPGFIRPMRGVRSKTPLYQAFYTVLGPLLPLIQRFFRDSMTTTEVIGRAMIQVTVQGYPRPVLETADINQAALETR